MLADILDHREHGHNRIGRLDWASGHNSIGRSDKEGQVNTIGYWSTGGGKGKNLHTACKGLHLLRK